jgi:peptide/nickel transport system permease protein
MSNISPSDVGALATDEITSLAELEAQANMVQRSPRQIAWTRLKRNKVALFSGFVALFFLVLAFGAPIWTAIFGVNPKSTYPNVLDSSSLPLHGFNGINWHHPFGFEPGTGRDLFALMLYGSRISFSIAIITSLAFVVIGMILAIVAGLYGGKVDNAIGRASDFLLAFPVTFFVIALSAPLTLSIEKTGIAQGNGARIIMLVSLLVIFSWPGFYRVVRSQVLSLREKEFVLAAVSLGASNRRIIFKEILPNLYPLAIIYLSISLPGYLAAEATFSFLGVGVQAPASTWGITLDDAQNYWQQDPIYLIIPTAMIILVVLALNLFGDGLRDALDTKSDR